MCNLGVRTLPNTQTCSLSKVARHFLGLAVVLAIVSQAHAQQYFYYPQRVAPSYQPQYYYAQPAPTYTQTPGYYYTTQPYQTYYTPQYYQYYYPTQYYQAGDNGQTYQTANISQNAEASAPPSETTTDDGRQVIQAAYTATAEPAVGQPVQEQPAQWQPSGDPYGFMAWLNATRASYGLGAVGYDENLSNWAAMNNSQQMARGLGHFVMGPARRQNSAAGGVFPGAMWMASGPHRAALLDPTITWFGIAAAGAYWTFNAY
jgi:uncharacterized protein YkwD